MWNDDLIPHIITSEQYRQKDVLKLLKSIGIDKRSLPRAFLRIVDWIADRPISGTMLIEGLSAYKPVRGRKPILEWDKKTIRFPMRVTERELCFLQSAAKIHHLSLNSFILALVLKRPLPSPDHGMNIETAHCLDSFLRDLDIIVDALWDGRVEFVSLRLFEEIREQISRVRNAMDHIHKVQLHRPPGREKKNKTISIVLSMGENQIITNMCAGESKASVIRSAVFSKTEWSYYRSIAPTLYSSFKNTTWDLNQAAFTIKTGEDPPVKNLLITVAKLLNVAIVELTGCKAPQISIQSQSYQL